MHGPVISGSKVAYGKKIFMGKCHLDKYIFLRLFKTLPDFKANVIHRYAFYIDSISNSKICYLHR